MKPRFTIFTPVYTDKSAGIWLLHYLCDRLNHLGYPSSLVPMLNPVWVNPEFQTPIAYDPESIVIYPEIVLGNPLGARKVVRYLLNREAALLGQNIAWGPTDFPLSYSKVFRDDCDVLYYPVANLDVFYRDERNKEGFCLYRGKADYQGPIPQLDYLEITRTWPQSKQELAEIFRNRLLLFSCDTFTSTVLDAALCGCVPVVLKGSHVIGELGKFWANDLSEVMDALQEIATLPDRIRELQNNFDLRLNAIALKIARHFEMHESMRNMDPVALSMPNQTAEPLELS